jgi:AcrR family transcriptional regulator
MTSNTLLKSIADRGNITSERKNLQRFDWLLAALQLFVSEGIDALRITRLAEELDVTRGSFYWHFNNREDLIAALVEYWRDKNTNAILNAMKETQSLSDGIFRFFDTCVDTELFDPQLDLAIREWARRSEAIRAAVDNADNQRIEAITDFYTRYDYPMPQAFIRARVLYFAQIGFYALAVKEPLATRISYTEAYFEAFTGQTLNPREAEAYRTHVIETFGDKLP